MLLAGTDLLVESTGKKGIGSDPAHFARSSIAGKMADNTEKGAEAVLESDKATEEETEPSDNFKAVVLGGTGATGRYLVGELLSSKSFSEITLLGRRKLTELPESFKFELEKEEESGRLKQEIIDLDEANEENTLKYFEGKDAYFSVFGTTRSAAGGNANFRKIDYGVNVKFAEFAKKAGVPLFSLMSSSGAHSRSFVFYLKVKGQIEETVSNLGFPLLSIFRPGFLDRMQPPRLLERLAGLFMTKISVAAVAKAMVNDSMNQLKKSKEVHPYSHILSNHQILDLAKGTKDAEQKKDVAEASAAPESAASEQEKQEAVAEPKEQDVSPDATAETKPIEEASDDQTHPTEEAETPVAKDEEDKATK